MSTPRRSPSWSRNVASTSNSSTGVGAKSPTQAATSPNSTRSTRPRPRRRSSRRARRSSMAIRTAQLLVRVEDTDPRVPDVLNAGPLLGDLRPAALKEEPTMSGSIMVPTGAQFEARVRGVLHKESPWRFWLPRDADGRLVTGVGVRHGGRCIRRSNRDDAGFRLSHAIQVNPITAPASRFAGVSIEGSNPGSSPNRSSSPRCSSTRPLVAIERTGSWGMAPLTILWHDFHYPFVYPPQEDRGRQAICRAAAGMGHQRPHEAAPARRVLRAPPDRGGTASARASWPRRSAPTTRTENGTTEAEPGKYDDLPDGLHDRPGGRPRASR